MIQSRVSLFIAKNYQKYETGYSYYNYYCCFRCNLYEKHVGSVSSAFFKVDTNFRSLHDNDIRFQGSLFLYTNRSSRGKFK